MNEITSEQMQLDVVDEQHILTTQHLNSSMLLNTNLCNDKLITMQCIEGKYIILKYILYNVSNVNNSS